MPKARSIGASLAVLALVAGAAVASPDLPVVLKKSGRIQAGSIPVPGLRTGRTYTFLFSARSPSDLTPVEVSLEQETATIARRVLHMGDPDLYVPFRAIHDGPAEVRVSGSAPGTYTLQVNEWPGATNIATKPNDAWQSAAPIALDQTIFASGDAAAYIPPPGVSSRDLLKRDTGAEWYRFDFDGTAPKLVFFQIELLDRDNLPVDVSVYRLVNGEPKPYYDGEDPVAVPHEVQALPGNKFTTRILKERGTYYLKVRANHPEYQLRTRVYDAPPYDDPKRAVQTAVDYILAAGDSWHANTPRRGGILDRVASVHQETSLCVACHPTHFSQRAQLIAKQNGYLIHERRQLQFLAERFYNNPRPFYGFEKEGAVWARVISASANVLSRMSVLLDVYERNVTGERRNEFHDGVTRYLELYYKDRDQLPPDETNGNTPLVSTYEVAWYSWRVTHDARIAKLMEQDQIKDMLDLCYQTLALADIDRTKYADKIRRNAERILSLQRPDGQWAMRFEPNQPEAEFQTGHALWALHAAGIPVDNPQVAKGLRYLMGRQQPFGGWMDPLQSYENFRTPFRETQMAVLALSSYYPGEARRKGWGSEPPETLSADPSKLCAELSEIWERPSDAVVRQIQDAAASNEPLIRQQALEALGRLAIPETLPAISSHLGDSSKLVQRTAAWAVRQVYSRHAGTPAAVLASSLASASDRTRWGATRVFANHFSALARIPELATGLAERIDDPVPSVRMQAIKGMWQYWFWTADETSKNRIEDAILRALGEAQHPWVERNLREAVYNIADENIRYLYNNWVPLLAKQEDRDRAIRGRLAVESRLAEKFARVLETGSDRQRKMLLTGLTEFHLRRGDTYDLNANPDAKTAPVYNRIGNDTEQIAFFGPSADRFARALEPLLDSKDPEMRRLAINASLLTRDVKFPGVNEIAGRPGKDRADLLAAVDRASDMPAEVRKALHPAPAATARASAAKSSHRARPDEAYFRAHVEPILTTRGKDGYACIHCHATHTIFNATYSTALNVIDLDDPENSLILRKPTSSSDTEGTLGAKSHGGGIRWEKGSVEYNTILEWIRGAH